MCNWVILTHIWSIKEELHLTHFWSIKEELHLTHIWSIKEELHLTHIWSIKEELHLTHIWSIKKELNLTLDHVCNIILNMLKQFVWETQKWHWNFRMPSGSLDVDQNVLNVGLRCIPP